MRDKGGVMIKTIKDILPSVPPSLSPQNPIGGWAAPGVGWEIQKGGVVSKTVPIFDPTIPLGGSNGGLRGQTWWDRRYI